jgi:hypothetical protein
MKTKTIDKDLQFRIVKDSIFRFPDFIRSIEIKGTRFCFMAANYMTDEEETRIIILN